MNNKISSVRLFVGLLLIILGGTYLLNNLNIIHINIFSYIFSLPGLMIFIGLISLINSKKVGIGLVLIAIGSFWMTSRFINIDFWEYFWGIILLIIGLYILLKPKHDFNNRTHQVFGKMKENYSKDKIDDVAIFGGGEKRIVSENFQGGNITAIFGGSDIDLTSCKLANGENFLDVFIIFGGTDIKVPADWNVIVDVFPLFGGFGNKRHKDPSRVYDQSRTLIIKGIVVFGGGEVKSF
jgi:predicted membrane protein